MPSSVVIFTITQKELQDARRNRWYLIYVLVFAGLSLALAWLVIGVGVTWAATRALASRLDPMLFEVDPGDPRLWLTAVALLSAATLAAAWLPARRATRVDPIRALRES